MTPAGRGLVPGLAVSETVSWGILYYTFPVLLPAMERDLGWSRTTLIGAFTVAVIVSGVAALPVGRLLDQYPARPLMTVGSSVACLAVVGWAATTTIGAFYAVWIVIGAAMALVLYEPAQVVLVKQFGARATRAITTLTLVAGFASTIFQPTTALLADHLGWRTALVALAGALAVITIPIHLAVLPGRRSTPKGSRVRQSRQQHDRNDHTARVLTVAFTLSMATMAAGIVHLIPYLVDRGWSSVLAATAAGTLGATQVAARLAFGPLTRRTPPSTLAAGILGLPAVAVLILAIAGGDWPAWIAISVLGAAQGMATLLRPMLLSRLHGAEGYGRLAATSAATTTIARAMAPLMLAALAAAVGYATGFVLFAMVAVVAAVLAAAALTEDHPAAADAISLSEH